ncbi:hypothetical protein V6N13_149225 [Hibiscus sabdariffa]|uniref:Leucine-rich repeat-containing N-terminal plant-type domain-containing protein n=2 Tax=Hibiscus sabdariffa TaxID=183260 RepID=A0ABR2EHZ4_9ROSI
MKISLVSWFIFSLYIATFFSMAALSVSGQCQSHQQQLLLGFKNSLNSSLSVKLGTWNQGTDCCSWDGITCYASGRVTELDLSSQWLSGEISNSNGFTGKIPVGISYLTKLVTLDLSQISSLEMPNLKMVVQNLTGLKNLYLDGVNTSANGMEWSQALTSSLPNLQVLSMVRSYLSGPIGPSLVKLKSLSIILLDDNNLSGPILKFLAEFQNLTSLHLAANNFSGSVPEEILQSPKLQTLDLSSNRLLQGSFQNFPPNASLQSLVVGDTDFGGQLPESIGNLDLLTRIELAHCKFTGPIPKTLEKLTHNNFSGPLPSFTSLRNLTELILLDNQLNGSILSTNWSSLPNLVSLGLGRNSFSGLIPLSSFQKLNNLAVLDLSYNHMSIDSSFTNLPNVTSLNLASCNLTKFPEFLKNLSNLYYLDLSSNQIHGEIPSWIWKTDLESLNLSLNLLVELETPSHVSPYMFVLDLHGNQLQGRISFLHQVLST